MNLTADASTIVTAIRASKLEPEINAVLDLEAASENASGESLPEWFEITCSAGHERFGFDGSGGEYHILSDGRILLVDSEGFAGVIAKDFGEYIAIATGLESWRAALRFMENADLSEARGAWLAFAEEWGLGAEFNEPWEYPFDDFSCATPREARTAISTYFSAPALDDPFAALYSAIHELNGDITVTASDGNRFRLLGHS